MSIAAALFSDSQSRLLQWVFGQPERGFHLSELRRLTGLGSASLQRELNRLAKAGLVHSERVGNLRRFQANAKSPVYRELVGLTRKTLGIEPMLRAALKPLTRNLQTAFVYGSVAKRQDTAASDIDLMLISDKLSYADVFAVLEEVGARLGRPVNPTLMTRKDLAKHIAGDSAFVTRVLSQPKLWLIGSENALAV